MISLYDPLIKKYSSIEAIAKIAYMDEDHLKRLLSGGERLTGAETVILCGMIDMCPFYYSSHHAQEDFDIWLERYRRY